jgi:hypothetical protein
MSNSTLEIKKILQRILDAVSDNNPIERSRPKRYNIDNTPESPIKWRTLGEEEIIQRGDRRQLKFSPGWESADSVHGHPVREWSLYEFQRPIPQQLVDSEISCSFDRGGEY